MKKTIFTFFMLMMSTAIFAQTSGTVTYEQVVKLEIKLEGESAQFASMMPKERKSLKSLSFNEQASLYKNLKADEEQPMAMEHGGAQIMIKMNEPDNQTFTNLSENTQIEQREFMTRQFLIEGKPENKWKLTGNQKTILGYPCQEAILEGAKEKTSAWFTPAVPVQAGPGSYSGLPGLVLVVDINDGKNVITAQKVDLTPIDKSTLAKPKEGKKVTRAEFDKIVEEKAKEMGVEPGQGQTHMMIRVTK
jgi:GLPGLI family protein